MKQIPMLDLQLQYQYMKDDIDAAIRRCLEHQRWILGPEVRELEEKIASYLDVRHCIGCSSGTEALVLSLRALAIQTKGQEYWDRDDLIITTPFTFTATGDAILRAGATPLFVDIDAGTYNIDPQKIRAALETSPLAEKVVGIIPVHLYGQGCDMDRIMAIAGDHDLFVVEDTAQAFGGSWKGKKLGSIGTTGCFSFFPSKNLGCFGDGGMVSTDDQNLAELMTMLMKHGGKDKYDVEHIGYNARLDTLQAAILLARLTYIDECNERRIATASLYSEGLKDIPELALPLAHGNRPDSGSKHVFHQYTLRLLGGDRDGLQEYLKQKGISSMVYYPVPLHEMKVFKDAKRVDGMPLDNSEEACKTVLSLPMEPFQTAEVTKRIISELDGYTNRALGGGQAVESVPR